MLIRRNSRLETEGEQREFVCLLQHRPINLCPICGRCRPFTLENPPSVAPLSDRLLAYIGGFLRPELPAMKGRGRNSSTCPTLFRERRKVAGTILHEVISFLSAIPHCPTLFTFISTTSSFTPPQKGPRLSRPCARNPQRWISIDSPLLVSQPVVRRDIKGLLEWPVRSFRSTIPFRATATIFGPDGES